MAYVFGSVGAVATSLDATSGAGGLACPLPSGLAQDDLLVILAAGRPTFGLEFALPGTYQGLASSSDLTTKFFGKKSGAGEGSPTLVADQAGLCACVAVRFTGAPSTIGSIVHNSALATSGGGGFSFDPDIVTPALAVTEDGTLILYGGATSDDFWVPGTQPNGSTQLVAENIAGGGDMWLALSYEIQTTAANVPSSKFDSTSALTGRSSAIVLSLRSLADPTPPPPGRRIYVMP